MRAKFSRTVQACMQKPELYCNPGTHVWTPDQCALAEKLLTALRSNTQASDDDICLQAAATVAGDHAQDACKSVWARMQTYPYVFEVAAVRGTIDELALDGTKTNTTTALAASREPSILCSTTARWRVPLADFHDFSEHDKLTPALFELFAFNIRQRGPNRLFIGKWHLSRKLQFPIPHSRSSGTHLACFPVFFTRGLSHTLRSCV